MNEILREKKHIEKKRYSEEMKNVGVSEAMRGNFIKEYLYHVQKER